MNNLFSLLFVATLIWLIIEWRRNKKAGLKLQQKGKGLLLAVVAFFFLVLFTTPADEHSQADDRSQTAKSTSSAEQKKSEKKQGQQKSSAKSSSSSQSVDKQENEQQQAASGLLAFTGKKQLVLGSFDQLKRATGAHIQLQDKDEPKTKRSAKLDYNPVGWHNFKFYYGDGSRQAWLMNRGHLVGYQFSGLNDEGRNLVPETAWMNAGNYQGTNDGNQEAMLYYENRLDSWLANHPNYWLDYRVTPIYQGDELIPRQVQLDYAGLDSQGKILTIKLGSAKETTDANGVTHVVLENVSPNATIDYASGRATNTVAKAGSSKGQSEQTSSNQTAAPTASTAPQESVTSSQPTAGPQETGVSQPSQPTQSVQPEQQAQVSTGDSNRTVYVTGNGKSNVYWYGTESMPVRTNKANIVTMTEAQAQALGKRHSATE